MDNRHVVSWRKWCGLVLSVGCIVACTSQTPAPTPTPPLASATVAIQPTGIGGASTATPSSQPSPIATAIPPTATLPPTATPIAQQITIETPAPGTLVGSPVVLTGRATRFPAAGSLRYRITGSGGRSLGEGLVPVNGADGQSARFAVLLNFNLPAVGGDIKAEIFEPGATGQPVASTSLDMFIAPPQAITIETPASGTLVGNPAVLTGRVARLPYQSNMAYQVVNQQGQQIGQGLVPVNGAPGRPAAFAASIVFALPVDGGPVRVALIDQNAVDGTVAASAALNLQVAPQQQVITIDTPPAGTQVGSPVVITGRTVRYPYQGSINYRITNQHGGQIGVGAFNVNGSPGRSATFNASIAFAFPQEGGPIRIELFDQNANTGVIVASRAVTLQTAPPQPAQQTITIDTPAAGVSVGSPIVITGRTALFPSSGRLTYRVSNAYGTVFGEGEFRVNPIARTGQPGSTFTANFTFALPPPDTVFSVELRDIDPATGRVIASTLLPLRTAP